MTKIFLTLLAFGLFGVVLLTDKNSNELVCPTSGLKLTPEMINDNRCDCPEDGFDEPKTAACENGKFYCKNTKGLEVYIPSFKVNDGVCDCCDGSDEYLNLFGIKCENTCHLLEKDLKRAAYLDQAKIKKAKRTYERNKIDAIEKRKQMKEKLAEIKLKMDEIDEKARDISKNPTDSENVETFLEDYRQKIDQLEFLISNLTITEAPKSTLDNQVDSGEYKLDSEKSESTWKSLINSKLKRAKDIISKIHSIRPVSSPVTTVTKYLPTVVTKTIVQYQPTNSYDYEDTNYDYEKEELQTQANELEAHMNDSQIFGPDSVFLALRGQCYTKEDGGFEYTLCWFEDVKQARKYGAGVSTGKWKGWAEKIDADGNTFKDYKHMIYDEGDWCVSNGRETHVYLECGWSEKIISVDETSTCVYQIKFSTPLACIL